MSNGNGYLLCEQHGERVVIKPLTVWHRDRDDLCFSSKFSIGGTTLRLSIIRYWMKHKGLL